MAGRISIFHSKELQGVLLALKGMDKETAKHVRRETKNMIQPAWQKGLAERAATRLEHRTLVSTARVAVSNQNVTLKSATVGRTLAGGLQPKQSWHAVEFGGDRAATRTYQARSRKGKTFTVTRRTMAQLRPRNRKGYVVYPTAAEIIPRLASLWVQTVIRSFYDTIERK